MKNLSFFLVLLMSMSIYAQEDFSSTKLFIRVYDLTGHKIAKGYVSSISDKTIHLLRRKTRIEIPITRIGKIKTKRSDGNNVLAGAVVGGGLLGIIGTSATDSGSYVSPSTPQEGFVFGAAAGVLLGAPIGGLTALFKNSETYVISGELKNAKAFRDLLIQLKNKN